MNSLELMLEDMKTVPAIYRPTNYWDVLLPKVMANHQKYGLEKVKYHPHFVPVYRTQRYRSHNEKRWDSLYRFLSKSRLGIFRGFGRMLERHVYNSPEAVKYFYTFIGADYPEIAPKLTQVNESEKGGGRIQVWLSLRI